MRIAVAGFQHETNTFSPDKTELKHFRMADSWPGLLQGQGVLSDTRGMNLPIAGAIQAAADTDTDVVPILWCAAEPAGFVTDDAFDWVCSSILNAIKLAAPLDAVYLDLHGAMVTESHEDGEGELLRRLRNELDEDFPIGVSLDLHANVSPLMVEQSTLITIYRTYPHLDMAETGARCMRHLIQAAKGETVVSSFRQIPFLIPLHAQYTGVQPCRALYESVAATEQNQQKDEYTSLQWAELALGFTASDIHDCGPSVLCYAGSQAHADRVVQHLYDKMMTARTTFDTKLYSPAEAVFAGINSPVNKPVVIADVQDNPGAGGTSDTTGLLQALVEAKAQAAVLGVMCDPDIADRAHRLGEGARFQAMLGASSGFHHQKPLECECHILSLSDGKIEYSGEMYGGGVATLGPSCLLAVNDSVCDIRVVVSSIRIQCLDRALFTHFGVNLEKTDIICVKSTVHFRADFEPLCSEIINTMVPGTFCCEPRRQHYRNLRQEMAFLDSED